MRAARGASCASEMLTSPLCLSPSPSFSSTMKKNISQEFVDGMCKGLDAWVDAANKVEIRPSLLLLGTQPRLCSKHQTRTAHRNFPLALFLLLQGGGQSGKT
jgi:hypothetical protein